MVSELSTSPTQHQGHLIKTFTFNNSPNDGKGSGSIHKLGSGIKPRVIVEKSDLEEDNLECLGSFATGMLCAFDNKLKTLENMSRSLPNVFTASSEFSRISLDNHSPNASISSEEYILEPSCNGNDPGSSPYLGPSLSPSHSLNAAGHRKRGHSSESLGPYLEQIETPTDSQRPSSAQ